LKHNIWFNFISKLDCKELTSKPIMRFGYEAVGPEALYEDIKRIVAVYGHFINKRFFHRSTINVLKKLSSLCLRIYSTTEYKTIKYFTGFKFCLGVLEELSNFKLEDSWHCLRTSNVSSNGKVCSIFSHEPTSQKLMIMIYRNGKQSSPYDPQNVKMFLLENRGYLRGIHKIKSFRRHLLIHRRQAKLAREARRTRWGIAYKREKEE